MWLFRVGRWSAIATRTIVTPLRTTVTPLRTTVTLPASRRHLLTAAYTQYASTRTKVLNSPIPPIEIVNNRFYDFHKKTTEKNETNGDGPKREKSSVYYKGSLAALLVAGHLAGEFIKYQEDRTTMLPPMLILLVKPKDPTKGGVTCIKFVRSGVASIEKDLSEEFLKKYKEHGLVSLVPISDDRESYINCGALVANMQMKIIDRNTGIELHRGQTGEVCIPWPTQLIGNLKTQKKTEEKIVNGWIRTGYIGYLNEKNHLFIVGRKKELIKGKGRQVATAKFEDALLDHPLIADATVIVVEDKKDIQKYIDEHLAEHEYLLLGVEFLSTMPELLRSLSIGKILSEQDVVARQQKKINTI